MNQLQQGEKIMSSKIITSANPGNYQVLPYDGPQAGYIVPLLDAISDRIHNALAKTSQILAVPLIVRYPRAVKASPDNRCFGYFIDEYRRALNRDKRRLLHYVWCVEQHLSDNPHYHLLLIIDGNFMRHFALPPFEVNAIWGRALRCFYGYEGSANGLIHINECGFDNSALNHGQLIHRENTDLIQHVLEVCSYVAKIRTKLDADRVRSFGYSKITG